MRVSAAGSATGGTAPVWQLLSQGLDDIRITCVVAHPTSLDLLYAGSERAVYSSVDRGRQWQQRLRCPASAQVTFIGVDPFDGRRVLVATTHGLYGSLDGGAHWTRLFQAAGEGKSWCRVIAFHPTRRDEVWLGTAGGLFRSLDGGQSWQEPPSPLTHQSVHDLAIDPQQPDLIYALADHGLFAGSMAAGTWKQIAVQNAPEEPVDGLSAGEEPSEASKDAEENLIVRELTTIAVDPRQSNRLYLAGREGLLISEDTGATWRQGALSTPVHHLIVQAHSPTVAYAATPAGVIRYRPDEERWETLDAGLPTRNIHFLAATPTHVFAATDQGLYQLDLTEEQLAQGDWPGAEALLDNFVHEPTISQVQRAAIRYAEVEPEKIQRWRRQAALKALLPTFSMGYDRNRDTYVTSSGSTTNPTFDRIITATDPSSGFDLSLNWDLGDLLWSTDQTSIDVRSKLMVQLRDDIVDEVTRAYFERRRLQVALLTDPPPNPRGQLEKELRIRELTATLDGLTGGWFSKQIAEGNWR